MKLSVVATLFRSEPYLREFLRRSVAAATALVGDDFEIVLVNDGSPDDSLALALELQANEPRLKIVDLSRNFGHHQAMMAGLTHCVGERIFLIDSDLEEAPEWLTEFADEMAETGSDVVFGVQKRRKGGWFERWSGRLYYRLLNSMLDFDHPRDITTSRLMTRRYVEALLQHKERAIVISCLWHITGFSQTSIPVEKRHKGISSYQISRKLVHAVNTITSFSAKPLVFIFFTGAIVFFFSVIYVGYLVINKLIYGVVVDGWTSVIASVWILGGMIISFVGLIGIYLSKVFLEAKTRPLYIVRAVYE